MFLCPAQPRRRPPSPGTGGGGSAVAPGEIGVPPRTWEEVNRTTPPSARPPQPPKHRTSKPRTLLLLYRPCPRATRRPPGRGSSRSCRAERGARTPGPPWCSRCCSTGTPGPSPGCWAVKTLRGRGRQTEKKKKKNHSA